MAHYIINFLKVVNVDVHAGQRILLPLRTPDFFNQPLIKMPPVANACQRIGQAQIFKALIVDDIFKADGSDGGLLFDEVGSNTLNEAVGVSAAKAQVTN